MEDVRMTAVHEAGHVLVATYLGGQVSSATLEREGMGDSNHCGETTVLWPAQRSPAERAAASGRVALAGPLAEALHADIGSISWPQLTAAAGADAHEIERAIEVVLSVDSRTREEILDEWLRELSELFHRPEQWERLQRIADQLEAHETIDAALIEDVLG